MARLHTSRRRWLKAALLVAGPLALGGTAVVGAFPVALAQAAPLRALSASPDWLNTPPLRAEDLRGKVVVVNFWTYSCINSLRALPYLRAWSAKYRDQGLVVIGVHTPEFAFEKDSADVRQAVKALGVDFPVALDSDWRTWRAFDNNAWPAFYFIDAEGRVRHQAIGEGNYDQSERTIQKLLSEAGKAGVPTDIATITGVGPEAPADLDDLGSETLLQALAARIRHGVVAGELAAIDADEAARYLLTVRGGLKMAARGGASFETLAAATRMALRGLGPA